jgi:hypothetical protein
MAAKQKPMPMKPKGGKCPTCGMDTKSCSCKGGSSKKRK